jgi:cell wall-associated NlpC family hydrolase
MHWATKYIGMPYELGARREDCVDCWGLLWLIYHEQFGIELPEFPGIAAASAIAINSTLRDSVQSDWIQIPKPFEGCAVGMGMRKALHHVGVYVNADGGRIVHGWDGRNVVADTLKSLSSKGFRTVAFFRHLQWPS